MSKIPGLSGLLAEEHHHPKLISGGLPSDLDPVEDRFTVAGEDGASMVGDKAVGITAKLTTVEYGHAVPKQPSPDAPRL